MKNILILFNFGNIKDSIATLGRRTAILMFCLCISAIYVQANSGNNIQSIKKLTERIVPEWKNNFVFEYEAVNSDLDFFEIETKGEKIKISGNNNTALAAGLNYYLKYCCETSVSWYNVPVELPSVMPKVPNKIRKDANFEYRFFLNYCTFGYTMPWWKWSDWERLIDWMALNGVNMPLAITGQEAIWYNVWKKIGLSDKQIREYFTGPAFLPWHRMSNIDRWEGPLPQSWLKNQLALQKKIVKRERELGMTPVLPAFAGHVPLDLKELYPDAKITTLGQWGGFDEEYQAHFLDPFDPLFAKIQQLFLEEQTKQYGTDHIYGIDPFNEVTPPSWEPAYLADVSKTIYKTLTDVDKDAIWLQMGWLFYHNRKGWTKERIESYLNAVPKNKMIILDYYAERTEVWKLTDNFFGQPYIWNYLGSFGGNTMLMGNIEESNKRINEVIKGESGNLKGIGSTLESLSLTNPIMYEFIFDKNWYGSALDTREWVGKYAASRHGTKSSNSQKAWEILHEKVYAFPPRLGQGSVVHIRPNFEGKTNWVSPRIDYDNKDLLKAWEYLLKDKSSRSSYKFDVVNIGRQVLENHFSDIFKDFVNAYKNKDIAGLQKDSIRMMHLINDIDDLLNTQRSFLLGKWLGDAESITSIKEEKPYYYRNAKMLITTWNGPGQHLNDYANRSYAGLVKDFYGGRWELFLESVISSVREQREFSQKEYNDKIIQWEWDWVHEYKYYPPATSGSSIEKSQELYLKYARQIQSQ